MTANPTTTALTDRCVHHPGIAVPERLRPWEASWSAYAPVDITPPALRPDALADPEPWVIDLEDDPARVADWPRRQADAVVPYRLDASGRPLNPNGRTGRTGRDLPRWGENAAADPIVIAGTGAGRRVLLIRRDDVGQWAIPGGMVDPGETAGDALVRELSEETGLDLAGTEPDMILRRGHVADRRNTDHAWVCSITALFMLPGLLPATAGDDAADARWWPLTFVDDLIEALAPHGGLYPAHEALLTGAADVLGYHF